MTLRHGVTGLLVTMIAIGAMAVALLHFASPALAVEGSPEPNALACNNVKSGADSDWVSVSTSTTGMTVTWNTDSDHFGTSGTVVWSNVDYNRAVGAGQSTEFGFQGTGSGDGLSPTCAAA